HKENREVAQLRDGLAQGAGGQVVGFDDQDLLHRWLRLPPADGLRYHDKAITPGAQTERWGDAGPVRTLLGGMDSPTAWVPMRREGSMRSTSGEDLSTDLPPLPHPPLCG